MVAALLKVVPGLATNQGFPIAARVGGGKPVSKGDSL